MSHSSQHVSHSSHIYGRNGTYFPNNNINFFSQIESGTDECLILDYGKQVMLMIYNDQNPINWEKCLNNIFLKSVPHLPRLPNMSWSWLSLQILKWQHVKIMGGSPGELSEEQSSFSNRSVASPTSQFIL